MRHSKAKDNLVYEMTKKKVDIAQRLPHYCQFAKKIIPDISRYVREFSQYSKMCIHLGHYFFRNVVSQNPNSEILIQVLNSTSKMISERTVVIRLPEILEMSFRKYLYFETTSKKA